MLKDALGKKDLPHLMFYGPPGTGKTSAAKAIARQLYGDQVKLRCLELNASDERGIQTVRNKIKQFASGAVGRDCACGFKLIILDESDAMTKDAQSALRRTMELYSKVTRFVFICNYVSRIIEPLTSRCAKFRFKPFHFDVMHERLQYIADQEGLTLGEGALEAVSQHCGGDMRKAVTLLQSSVRLNGTAVEGEHIAEVAEAVPPGVVNRFLAVCKQGQFKKIQAEVEEFVQQSYVTGNFLNQLQEKVIGSSLYSDRTKAQVCDAIARCDAALTLGSTDYAQLIDLGARCGLAIAQKASCSPLAP